MAKSDSPPPPDSRHTPWSDPGDLQARLRELPSEPAAIPDALENFVIHHAIARHMGLGRPNQTVICGPCGGSWTCW
jgi:hypothetical protein